MLCHELCPQYVSVQASATLDAVGAILASYSVMGNEKTCPVKIIQRKLAHIQNYLMHILKANFTEA